MVSLVVKKPYQFDKVRQRIKGEWVLNYQWTGTETALKDTESTETIKLNSLISRIVAC
jgi:hypothetical protein